MSDNGSEEILFKANERLLKSKAFILFAVDENDAPSFVANFEHLTIEELVSMSKVVSEIMLDMSVEKASHR